jgi:hypothetical protein
MATQTQPKNLKHARPPSGLTGWAAAWSVLDKVDDKHQRESLALLVRNLGVQGAPALKYAADTARWMTGMADYVSPPAAVKRDVVAYIERRVREELRVTFSDGRFPRMRKLDG